MKAENTPAAKAAFPEPPRKAGGSPPAPGHPPSDAPRGLPGTPAGRLAPCPTARLTPCSWTPFLATTDSSWEPLPNQRSKRCRCI